MENFKWMTAALSIPLAIGGALIAQPVEDEKLLSDNTAVVEIATSELGHRQVSNNPATCEPYQVVDCNPIDGPALCTVMTPSGEEQLFDSNCEILYKNW